MDATTSTTGSTPAERSKRRCKGTNTMGQPCRAPTVGADGWCSAHRPGAVNRMSELGKLGGKASVKAKQDKERHARDRVRPFHDGRHTSITNAAAAGVSPAALMARAGHSDFATTQLYIDLAGETFRAEAEQLEERLFGQKLGQK